MYSLHTIDEKLKEIRDLLKRSAAGGGEVTVVGDEVGLAREITLKEVTALLRSISETVSTGVALAADHVGLARDETLRSILTQLREGVTVTGTLSITSQLMPITGAVSITNQPISVTPSVTFPVTGAVGIVADSVGLARESTLQTILARLSTSGVVVQNLLRAVTGVVGIAADSVGLAKETTLQQVRDRLPSSLTTAGNLKSAIVEDSVGLARDSTLQSILAGLSTSGVVVQNILRTVTGTVGIVADSVGLAKDSTLQQVRDRLPSSLTTAGNLKTAIVEDTVGLARDSTLQSILAGLSTSGVVVQNILRTVTGVVGIVSDSVGLARDSTLQQVRDRLPSSLTAAGNLKIAVAEDAIGLARDTTLQQIRDRLTSGVVVTGTVSIESQPVSVSPSTTFPVTGVVGIAADSVGLARDSTLQQIRDRLPASLTTAGNLKVSISEAQIMVPVDIQASAINIPIRVVEDWVGLARDWTLAQVRDRLPASLTAAGNLKTAVVEDSVGLARDWTVYNLPARMWGVNHDRTDQFDVHDTTTKTVTATYWNNLTHYNIFPRLWPVKTYAYYVVAGIKGRVDTPGATMYVRIRSARTGATSVKTITSTSDTWVYPVMTVYGPLNEWEGIYVDAYVTMGTGYITTVWLYVHPIDTVWALKSWNTEGFGAVPLFATSSNNLKIAVAEDTVGLARDTTLQQIRDRLPSSLTSAGNFRIAVAEDWVGLAKDSTVASLRLVGGTLNVTSITLRANTSVMLVGANSNRISVAVMNDSTGVLYIGPSSSSLGWAVYPGQAVVLNYTGALYGQLTVTGVVRIMEVVR